MPTYVELEPTHSLDPVAVIETCANASVQAVLIDEPALPAEFFDLSSGLVGELVNKLAMYQVRMAAVVPDVSMHSTHFQAFAREANRGTQFHFFTTRDEAIEWLETN